MTNETEIPKRWTWGEYYVECIGEDIEMPMHEKNAFHANEPRLNFLEKENKELCDKVINKSTILSDTLAYGFCADKKIKSQKETITTLIDGLETVLSMYDVQPVCGLEVQMKIEHARKILVTAIRDAGGDGNE